MITSLSLVHAFDRIYNLDDETHGGTGCAAEERFRMELAVHSVRKSKSTAIDSVADSIQKTVSSLRIIGSITKCVYPGNIASYSKNLRTTSLNRSCVKSWPSLGSWSCGCGVYPGMRLSPYTMDTSDSAWNRSSAVGSWISLIFQEI